MANEWHYTLNGQPAAVPVGAAQLKQLAASGQLKPSDLVWQDGMLEWAPASSVKGLFPTNKSTGDSVIVPPTSGAKGALGRKTTPPPSQRDWRDLHPLVVVLLTLASGGLFGFFYSYKICGSYAAKAVNRRLDGAGRALGRARHPFAVMLLSYLTVGIYFVYWLARALHECNEYLGRKDASARSELSLMLIFPPYALYVAVFVLPDTIRRAQVLAGMPETASVRHPILFLNPCLLLGIPLLVAIHQEALNQIWLNAP